MPYLWNLALEAHREGIPMMRAMLLEFPGDPACDTLDRQYMLGDSLLVAPVFTEDGTADFYLPDGRWTNLLTGQVQTGPGWRRERHDFLSLPLMVRPGTILPLGAVDDRPDYDYADGVTFRLYELPDGCELTCFVSTPKRDDTMRLNVRRTGQHVIASVSGNISVRWQLQLAGAQSVRVHNGARATQHPLGTLLNPLRAACSSSSKCRDRVLTVWRTCRLVPRSGAGSSLATGRPLADCDGNLLKNQTASAIGQPGLMADLITAGRTRFE